MMAVPRPATEPSNGARYLMRRLNTLSVYAQPSRNSALLQLAAELPAVVIADPLGVHVGTATKGIREASGNWASYVAERS